MNIIADLHTHTIASGHAYSTLMENINAAKESGIQILGISDHAPALEDAPKETYFMNLKVVHKEWHSLKILHGAELSILNEYGDVDLSDETLSMLDYTVASLHYPAFPREKLSLCTDAVIAAMHNPYIYILGHPDDDLMPLDYEAITLAAKRYYVALEVNNSSLSPVSFRKGAAENYRTILKLARNLGVPIIVSSDSHICYDIGNFSRALALLKELRFPEELIVNSSMKRLTDFFECRKNAAASANRRTFRLAV
ncbi:MAG: phosphatase [Clostridiales bacterium]|nr:phosphatase [Clostridiales bacterium]